MNALALRLYQAKVGLARLAGRDEVKELMRDASTDVGAHRFALRFLLTEWEQVVDAWQLTSWDDYRVVPGWAARRGCPTHSAPFSGPSSNVSTTH